MRRAVTLLMALPLAACAAANIAFTDANVRSFGGALCNTGCTNSFSGSTTSFPVASDGEVDFSVNIGTNTLSFTVCGSSNFKASIDEAAALTITPPGVCGIPALVVVSSSLTPGTHTVRVWAVASDTQFLTAASFVTDGSGSVASAINGTIYGVGKTATTFTARAQILNCPYRSTAGDSGYAQDWLFAYDGSFTFSNTENGIAYYSTGATAQSIYVYAPANTSWALFVDGVYNSTANIIATGGGFQRLSVTGLNASQHLYEWTNDNLLSGPGGIIYMMPGAGGTLDTTPAIPARSCIGIYGDSIAAYSNPSSGTTRAGYSEATRANGLTLMRMGFGGTRVGASPTGMPNYLRDNTAAITGGTNGVPAVVIMEGGVNDQVDYDGVSYQPTEFQTAYAAMAANMATGMATSGTVYAQQILPNSSTNAAQRGAYNTAMIAGIAAYNAAKVNSVTGCSYSTTGWVNTTTDMNGDGLHPIMGNTPSASFPFGTPLVGYGKISNRVSFILGKYGPTAASFSVSGPTTGTTGVTSSNFTVVPAVSGAVFSGETITIGDGGAGVFAASTGDSGTGSMTVTTVAGSASFTFTYRAASAGLKTISYSALADCWTGAAGNTFTAASNGGSIRCLGVCGIQTVP